MLNSKISERQPQLRDHVSVEITPEHDELVSSIKEKMENIAVSVCIFRVPKEILEQNENKYTPDHVSIGPLHCAKQTTVPRDDKWRYCYALLNRKPNLEETLSICVQALRELEHKARRCYEGEIDISSSDDFVQLLLIDGCFIIELFLKYAYKSLRSRRDPIFTKPGMLFNLRCDMALLENQIPFFVVQRLFQLVPIPSNCNESLNELASRFYRKIIPGDDGYVIKDKFNQEGYHLLDLIRHSILPTYPKLHQKEDVPPKDLDCAKKLKSEGIKFKTAKSHSFLDIKFAHGVFKIPPLEVHHYTETLLRNLIALEQRQLDDTIQHVTSYAFLMGCLITSEKDVKLLRRRLILIHDEKKDKEVSEMFKKLCKQIMRRDFYYGRLFQEVAEYIKTNSWHEKRQNLKDKHLKTPTSVMVFVVAIFLLLLTFVGACFSILSLALHHV